MAPADHEPGSAGPAPRGRTANLQAALDRLRGDRALLAELIRCFDEDCPKLLEQVRAAADSGQTDALRNAAHSLKGLAANFDAERTVAIAAQLERAALQNDLASAAPLVTQLRAATVELGQELEAFMAR